MLSGKACFAASHFGGAPSNGIANAPAPSVVLWRSAARIRYCYWYWLLHILRYGQSISTGRLLVLLVPSFIPSNARADPLTSASFTTSKTAFTPRTSQTLFEFRNTPCSSLTPCRSIPATFSSIRLSVSLLLSSSAVSFSLCFSRKAALSRSRLIKLPQTSLFN